MTVYSNDFNSEVVTLLNEGGIGVLRTDTLYGLVARADNETAVERMYKVKQRTPTKSPIVLVASTDQLFDEYSSETLMQVSGLWPGKNSIILPSTAGPSWITRGNASIAYRIPANEPLRQLLTHTGPLIAPSANPEGLPPASSIKEAKSYFGDTVDFYVDGGEVQDDTPSRLFRLLDGGEMERLR